MKKVFLLAFAMVITISLYSQNVSFGLKAGLNVSNLRYSSSDVSMDDNEKSLLSFHVAGFAEIALSDQFSVQPELMYTSTGTMAKGSIEGASYKTTGKFDYFAIPLMAKYYVAEGFSLEAGPQLGFLLAAKVNYDIEYMGESISESDDIKEDTNSMDLGLGFGAGYKLENGLFFNARYVLGMSNMIKDPADNEWAKNGNLQFSLGYKFH